MTPDQLRGYEMVPRGLREQAPRVMSTDGTPLADKTVYAKFFCAHLTWYLFELDEDEILTAFGRVENATDPHCSELGYFSLVEMQELLIPPREGRLPVWVERDLDWTPRRFGDIKEGISSL